MKAAIYTRVSTIEQANEGYSIGVQQDKLSQYARAMDYDVVGVYSDEGYSGKSLVRPAIEQLTNDIKMGKVDVVLIYKLDRLSRRVKDVLELVELFDKFRVTLFSLNENLDLSSPFGRAALKMSATFSELEREMILERMQMGKSARAKAGLYTVPGSNCPFGYRHDKQNDRMVIDETEAEIIRKLFDLYINQGYSFSKLYFYGSKAYPDCKMFSNRMCCKPILKRVLYAGYFEYKGELIKGVNFEPIIDYETYLRAQSVIEHNRSKRTSDCSPNLLTGLIYCGRCGNRYVGKLYDRYSVKPDGTHTKHYKYRSYGCAARVKRDKRYTPAFCDNPIIPVGDLDKYVIEFVKGLDLTALCVTKPVGSIDLLMATLAELKDKRNKLLDLYLDNIIDKDNYLLRLASLEGKINETSSLVESESAKIGLSPQNYTDIIKTAQQNFDSLTRLEQARLLRFIIKNIIINGDKVIISTHF